MVGTCVVHDGGVIFIPVEFDDDKCCTLLLVVKHCPPSYSRVASAAYLRVCVYTQLTAVRQYQLTPVGCRLFNPESYRHMHFVSAQANAWPILSPRTERGSLVHA